MPIAYHGRTYAEGKKIGWRDGINAIYVILRGIADTVVAFNVVEHIEDDLGALRIIHDLLVEDGRHLRLVVQRQGTAPPPRSEPSRAELSSADEPTGNHHE